MSGRPPAPPNRGAGRSGAADAPSPALSVVLPVYDEELVLEKNLARLVAHLEGLGRSFEIVCVNDGSRDRSPAILDAAAARDPRVVVHHLPANRGKGAAVRTGMRLARGEQQLFMDADLSTPLEQVEPFLRALEAGADLVLGNRRARESRIERRQPLLREWLGRGFTLVTRTVLAPGIEDFTCGFKAFRRDASRIVFERSSLDGWAFDAELVVIAHVHRLRIAQLPVRWQHEDDTKVRLVRAVLGSARELASIGWRRMRGSYR